MGDFISNIFGNGSPSYGGFGGDFGILQTIKPTINPIQQAGTGPLPVSTDTGASKWGIIQSLIGDGLGAYKIYTAADLASQQIKAGQYPSVIGQNGQVSGTANVAPLQFSATGGNSWLLIGVALLVAVLLLRK